jgi:hypothetical protein
MTSDNFFCLTPITVFGIIEILALVKIVVITNMLS